MEDDTKSGMEMVNAQPYSYCTDTKTKTYKHTWSIKNVHLLDRDYLNSSEYSSGDDKNIGWRWCLTLSENTKPLIRLTLLSTSELTYYFHAKVEMLIDDQKSQQFEAKEYLANSRYSNCVNVLRDRDYSSFTFNIELKIIDEFKCQKDCITIVPDPKVENYWTNLLEDKEFADVVLAVDGKEFMAHKAVLANRSPVFRAMLKHEMVESKQNRVTITDIESKVFEQLLNFIYTDSVTDLKPTMAFELLQAADKYDLEKLKTRCEAVLCGQISEETAVNTLVLADLYRADQLKRAATKFIGRNVGVIQTQEWKNLMLKNVELANGVIVEALKATY